MKRKFVYIGFSFLSGLVAFSIGWGKYNTLFICLAFLWTIAGIVCLRKYRIYILVSAFMFFSGVAFSTVYTYSVYNKIIDFSGKTVTIKGCVVDYSYDAADVGILTVKGKLDDGKTAQVSFFVPHDEYNYYDEIEIKGTVSAVTDTVDFQSEQYYRPKGVYLKGDKVDYIKLSGKNKNPLFRLIKQYRDYLFSRINSIVDGEAGGFLGAMLCGDKSELSYVTKQKLYRSGIGHIFSVSGMHMVIIWAFFGFFLKLFQLNRKIIFIIMEVVIWSFAVFAGLSPSVKRAGIMLTILLISDAVNRKGDCLNTLGLCCLLLTVRNPYCVRDPSFVLSMVGAFAFGVVVPKVNSSIKTEGVWGNFLKLTVSMLTFMFVTLPVVVLFFDEISLVAPLANIILVPLCTAALSITVFTVITGGVELIAFPVLKTAEYLIKAVLFLSDKVSSFRYSYITAGDSCLKAVLVFISMVGLLAVILPQTVSKRIISALAVYMTFITAFNVNRIVHKNEIHMVLVTDKNMCQTVLYKENCGIILDVNAKGEHNNALKRVIEKRGISSVKSVTVTDECYYSAQKYTCDFYPVPEKIIGDFEEFECNDFYSNTSDYEFWGMNIKRNNDNISVGIEGKNILISCDGFCIDDKIYSFDNSGYPLDLTYENGDFTVRRLDYGFNEQ
ncbi:MAG: ComEC/Rec2 family competence protein [Oscillospiraceae bacterium]